MRRTLCLTTFDLADLAPARVLAETVKAAHPDWTMQAVVIEEPGWTLPDHAFTPFDCVIPAADLAPPRFRPWIFGRDRTSARLPVAARAIRHALAAGAEQVVYLDADSAVFHPFDFDAPFDLETGDAPVLLAPQQISPSATLPSYRDGEAAAMRLGIFSPGFLVVRDIPEGRAFADWFDTRALRPIADGRLAGAQVEPLLCNLAPALFAGLRLVRDPGINVGSTNIAGRQLRIETDGRITVNGTPLRHFQFPRAGSPAETVMERNGRGDIALYELAAWHKRQTARALVPEAARQRWSFACFADGSMVTPPIRRLWRERDDLYAAFEDPFATGPDTFHAWLGRERPDLSGPDLSGPA